MCTYNGEKYLKEQLDSILRQTYPVLELVVQDDCSTDNTCAIIQEYAAQYPFIKLYRNEKQLGINPNFFSAMQRAHGDFIAISDQDDIWEDNKLEVQMNTIGDKMCCAGKSAPFACGNDVFVSSDLRPSNYNLLRLLFVGGFAGHSMLITRTLLDEALQLSPFFPVRYYDITLALVAGAHNSIAYVESIIVQHRRHHDNSTLTYFNPSGNSKTIKTLFHVVKESWFLYRKLKPQIIEILKSEERFLSEIHSQEHVLQDALKVLHLYSSPVFIDFIRLSIFCARRGNLLLFAQGKQTFSTFLRGAFFPIYCANYYKFLLK